MSTRIHIDRYVLVALLKGDTVCVGNIELVPKDLKDFSDRVYLKVKSSSTKRE